LPGQEAAEAVALAGGTTLAALFERAFKVHAKATAVTSDDRSWTYEELGVRADSAAAMLSELGARPGDRIAVLSETRHEFIEMYAAAARLGVALVALNARWHADDVRWCLQHARPRAVLVSGTLAPLAASVQGQTGSAEWVCFDQWSGFAHYEALLDAVSTPAPRADPAPQSVQNVLYTSGTTGRPKGAMISQQAAAIRGLRLAQWFGLGPEDGFIGWLPLYHCGGNESLYASILSGGTYAALSEARPEAIMRRIERDRLTWTLLLPGVITDLLNHPAKDSYDLASFRFAIGYANMMPEVVQQLTRRFRIRFSDAFGQTETSYLLANGWSDPGALPSLEKIQTPLLDLRLVDDIGRDVSNGVPGECIVRGPSLMSGYLDDPAATAEVFAGGWLHTGDLLRRNHDGSLTYVDRKRYLIKSGGENVYPAEVEAAIVSHPLVQEACVFAVPDERWGETVAAAVVLHPAKSLDTVELIEWCRGRLAGFKLPHYVRFVLSEDLPRSTTGKVQRHELTASGVKAAEAVT